MSVKFELKTPPGLKDDGSPLDPVEYVEIVVDPAQIVSRAATDEDRTKYKREYAAFKEGLGDGDDAPEPEVLDEEEAPPEAPKEEAPIGKELF